MFIFPVCRFCTWQVKGLRKTEWHFSDLDTWKYLTAYNLPTAVRCDHVNNSLAPCFSSPVAKRCFCVWKYWSVLHMLQDWQKWKLAFVLLWSVAHSWKSFRTRACMAVEMQSSTEWQKCCQVTTNVSEIMYINSKPGGPCRLFSPGTMRWKWCFHCLLQ